MTAELPFIEYGGSIVAVAGRTRCYFAVDDLDAAALNFVAVMCLCKREVDEGRIEGPFNSELAARWARLVLIVPHIVADRLITDQELADRLTVPIEQVAIARREPGHPLQTSRVVSRSLHTGERFRLLYVVGGRAASRLLCA